MRNTLFACSLFLAVASAQATNWNDELGLSLDDDVLEELADYELEYDGTVTGYIDGDDHHMANSGDFDGCEPGRIIIVDDTYAWTCSNTQPANSYRPHIYIFSNGDIKAVVNDEVFEME